MNGETKKISDMNILYDGFKKMLQGAPWKAEPQKFEIDFLSKLNEISKELENHTYQTSEGNKFTLNERGKIRRICGRNAKDRTVRHVLCDEFLNPALEPYLIYKNGASRKNKGIDFQREMFERDLHNYWLENKSNEGWIAFIDLSKFYDNIQHSILKDMIKDKISDDIFWLFEDVLDTFKVDVSYMNDEEYKDCINKLFNSVEYYNTVPDKLKTGKKYMNKSVDIGDQTSQSIGVYFPTPIDNYVTIVRGIRKYGRYMDDMYLIHKDKDYLEETLQGIFDCAKNLGLFINKKKTRICKLSDKYIFLQVKYYLTDSGKVVKRINPKSVTRERRKLKKYKHLLLTRQIDYNTVEQAYKSWMGKYTKIMSKKQTNHMKDLYYKLFGRNPRWKS